MLKPPPRFLETLDRLDRAPRCGPECSPPCGPGWYVIHGPLELPSRYDTRNLWFGSTRSCLRRAIRAALGLDPAASPALAAIALRLPDGRDADIEETPADLIGERVATWAHECHAYIGWVEVARPIPRHRRGPCQILECGLNQFYWEHPDEQQRVARLTMRLTAELDLVDAASFPGNTLRWGMRGPGQRTRVCVEGLAVGDGYAQRLRDKRWDDRRWPVGSATAVARAVAEVLQAHGMIPADALDRALRKRPAARRDGIRCRDAALGAAAGRPASDEGHLPAELTGALAAAPIGAWFAYNPGRAVSEAARVAHLLHGSAEAEAGAIAVAAAIATLHARPYPRVLEQTLPWVPSSRTRDSIVRAAAISGDTSPDSAAQALGNGARATCADTVPFALWCADRGGGFEEAMKRAAAGSSITATLTALVGALVATRGRARAWTGPLQDAAEAVRPAPLPAFEDHLARLNRPTLDRPILGRPGVRSALEEGVELDPDLT